MAGRGRLGQIIRAHLGFRGRQEDRERSKKNRKRRKGGRIRREK